MTGETSGDGFAVGYKKPPQHSRFQPGSRVTRAASRKAFAILSAMSNGRSRFPSGSMNREGQGVCRLRKPPCCG
jgi:hypothetical protein